MEYIYSISILIVGSEHSFFLCCTKYDDFRENCSVKQYSGILYYSHKQMIECLFNFIVFGIATLFPMPGKADKTVCLINIYVDTFTQCTVSIC